MLEAIFVSYSKKGVSIIPRPCLAVIGSAMFCVRLTWLHVSDSQLWKNGPLINGSLQIDCLVFSISNNYSLLWRQHFLKSIQNFINTMLTFEVWSFSIHYLISIGPHACEIWTKSYELKYIYFFQTMANHHWEKGFRHFEDVFVRLTII